MNPPRTTNRSRYVLAFGHLCCDMNQGMLSALLPFFITAYHFDYTTAAKLVMFSNIAGSVIQPVFGHLSDRKSKSWLVAAGVLLAGGGMALTGLCSSFAGLCLAVIISGIGTAMFHPQAAQMVNRSSTAHNKGTSLGIFSFGGHLGFTLGPLLATCAVTLFGLAGTPVFILPGLLFSLVTALFFRETPTPSGTPAGASGEKNNPGAADDWAGFAKLAGLVICRSTINSGINTFLVLYFVGVLGQPKALSNSFLSVYYAISAVSALFGGRLADQYGYRKTLHFSYLILLPALALFTATQNLALSLLLLLPMGIGISLGYSPMVVLGQSYIPSHMGFASGVTLGLSVSVGGIIAPLLGKIGDVYGLSTVFTVICGLTVIPLLLSFWLNEPPQK